MWTNNSLLAFFADCASNGLEAVSLGGGEPLEYPGLLDLLDGIPHALGRSLTTNGLALDADPSLLVKLLAAPLDKAHVSIHFPERRAEVERAIRLVKAFEEGGIAGGVNLLVRHGKTADARDAYQALTSHGIGPEQIVLLPMKGSTGPTPSELGAVAGSANFQSMSCLLGCAASPRFASVGWDGQVAWCSYTDSRIALSEPTYQAMHQAMQSLDLRTC